MADSGLPKLADLVPTPPATFDERYGGERLRRLLEIMTLSCFTDRRGNIWVGIAAGEISEHDRWFYRIPHQIGNDDWDQLPYEIWLGCEKGTHYLSAHSGLLLELESMTTTFTMLAQRPGKPQQLAMPELARRYLLAFQRFGWGPADVMGKALNARWGRDLHDILEHYELWAARNDPDMPRDMALRLYGLGAYADDLSRGIDWLDLND
jgi:uncharacterized protein (DUF3820 family)